MEKITIVINGVGGCGKDTLVEILGGYHKVKNISSITPIKEIAKHCGWNGEKTDKARKFLSDLKKLLTEYNEFPMQYLLAEQEEFLQTDQEFLFVHIREPHGIEKFKNSSKTKTYALLITPRADLQNKVYGNKSDDEVNNYDYDFTFANDKPLDIIEKEWIEFVENQIMTSL